MGSFDGAMIVVGAERVLVAVILIVDDEFFVREFAVSIVEELGYRTLSASDVDGAMFYLRSFQQIDALITDIRLNTAALGGYELAREATKLRPNLGVIYATGNSITEKVKDLFVEGAHFLQKPYSPDQLQNSLEKLLAAQV